MAGAPQPSIAEAIAARLAKFLGSHTARVALKVFSNKALGRGPDTVTAADVPALVAALRPMLNTLIGRARSEIVTKQIREEFGR